MGIFKISLESDNTPLDIPFSSDPIIIAVDSLKLYSYMVLFAFSDKLIIFISNESRCKIASLILLTLAIGILNTPPEDVLQHLSLQVLSYSER